MLRTLRILMASAALSLAVAASAHAQDSVLGTFTVDGKTTRFNHVYATTETAPGDASQSFLMLLVSDTPIAPADRSPDRLAALAKAGTLKAIRMRWRFGFDDITVVPYHSAIAESGRAFASLSTVNLSALDEDRVHAEFKSKMLGQTWFFNALVKAAIVKGGVAALEPNMVVAEAVADAPAESDPMALKRALGTMGYEFKQEAFFQAIADGKAQAVSLFLKAGMPPNVKDDRGHYALNYAVLFCAHQPAESAAVIQALVAGRADVKTKDPDNGTTPLVGSTQSCTVAAVEALVKAGSDLTAKSNGGMTALQLARIFQRHDLVKVLEKASAK